MLTAMCLMRGAGVMRIVAAVCMAGVSVTSVGVTMSEMAMPAMRSVAVSVTGATQSAQRHSCETNATESERGHIYVHCS
jgi:hypothetical protein